MDNCIFCKIAKHSIPSKIVNENEDFIAFLDINPISKGHTLVVPKKHIKDFTYLPNESADFIKNYISFIEETRKIVSKKYTPKGIRITFNTDRLIEVHHIHCHIIPVY